MFFVRPTSEKVHSTSRLSVCDMYSSKYLRR